MLNKFMTVILASALASGQLIRIPFAGSGVITLLDIISISFIIFAISRGKFKLSKTPTFLKLGYLFVFITIISLIFTPITLSKEAFIVSFSYIVRVSIYLSCGLIFLSPHFKNLRGKITPALLLSGVTLSIIGLVQFLIFPDLQILTFYGWDPHYFRTVSTFFDPNFAGAYFVLTLLLLSSLRGHEVAVAISNWKIASSLKIFAMTVAYIALLTTFSRSSYLMFLVSGIIFAFLKKSKKLFLSTMILFLVLFLGFQFYTQFVANPKNIDRGQSASLRIGTWEQGLVLFQKFPILGVGFNTYRYAIEEFSSADKQFIKSHGSTSNDSSLLFVLATTGLTGLIFYLLFLLNIVKSAFPKKEFLVAALGGLLIHSFFSNSLFYPFIFVWVILAAIA